MAILENLYFLVYIANLFMAVTVIFLERRNVGTTWAWVMILFFLPLVGFVLYLYLGQNLSKMRIYRFKGESREQLEAMVEQQKRQLEEGQIQFSDAAMGHHRDLIHMNLMNGKVLYTQDNRVEIFTDGGEKFNSLLQAIRGARRHVHLMYYRIRYDNLGRQLIQALADKAAEGVEVRFLYDDIGSIKRPRRMFKKLLASGGSVAAFFPSKIPYLNMRINFRNHRKVAVIDGEIGYIGGFNIGDEYLGKDPRFGYWRDTHLRLTGGAVRQLQMQFLLDWNFASTKSNLPLGGEYMPLTKPEHRGTVGVQIVSSGPDTESEQIKQGYIKMINGAKRMICLQTPYFIPDESVLTALKLAILSGVEVRFMIPAKPDHPMVYWASYSYLGDLLRIGMRCFLYHKGFLHAKAMVVDGEVGSVGTANIDVRSFRLNFEVNAFLYDTETAARLQAIFEEDMRYSTELTYDAYMKRSRWTKVKESVLRLLSPIL